MAGRGRRVGVSPGLGLAVGSTPQGGHPVAEEISSSLSPPAPHDLKQAPAGAAWYARHGGRGGGGVGSGGNDKIISRNDFHIVAGYCDTNLQGCRADRANCRG